MCAHIYSDNECMFNVLILWLCLWNEIVCVSVCVRVCVSVCVWVLGFASLQVWELFSEIVQLYEKL